MFSPADFAAYEERKWSSNAFTLERMKVREKFASLQSQLAHLFDSDDFAAHLSDEHPSIVNNKRVDAQWLYYTRSNSQAAELARFLEKTELQPDKIFNLAPQDKHASLVFVLNNASVKLGLIVHPGAWVDRKNFAAKLAQSYHKERLKALLSTLPSELRLGFDDEVAPAHDMELEGFDALAEMLGGEERRFGITRVLTADEAQAADLPALLQQTFEALLPVYRFLTWSRENDHIAVGEKLQKVKSEKRKNDTAFKSGDRVKVTGGLFAGKLGSVTSIDGKFAKVQVGPMAVSVAAVDLQKA